MNNFLFIRLILGSPARVVALQDELKEERQSSVRRTSAHSSPQKPAAECFGGDLLSELAAVNQEAPMFVQSVSRLRSVCVQSVRRLRSVRAVCLQWSAKSLHRTVRVGHQRVVSTKMGVVHATQYQV